MNKGLDNNKKIYFIDALMALFTALSLLLTMRVPVLNPVQRSDIVAEIFWNLKLSLAGKANQVLIVWLFLFVFYRDVSSKYCQNVYYYPMLAINVVLSMIWLMSEGYRIDNSLHSLICSGGQLIKSSIYFLGTFWGLDILSSILFFKLSERTYRENKIDGYLTKVLIIYRKHPIIIGVVVVLIAWLPHIIVSYPGYFCYDAFHQLAQYFGFCDWSSHHPPFCTYIMGRSIELGLLVNDSLGAYLFILVQAFIAAMVISYGFCLLEKMKTPYWIRIVYATSVILVPYYTAYVCVYLKDNLYSYCFLLMSIELIYLLIDGSEIAFAKKRHVLLWIIGFSGLLLFRNNGIYVGMPLFIALISNEMHKLLRKQLDGYTVIKNIVVFVLPFIISAIIGAALNSHYDIQKGSIREALSLPIQQTARYVKEHGTEVTEEEKAVIKAVLPYEELGELYDPRISDPVKGKFKSDPTRMELINYLTVWGKQFFKHPMVYINATLNQNYYCFYPFISNNTCYINTFTREQPWPYYDEVKVVLKIMPFEKLDPWKDRMYAFYQMCFEVPGLNLLSHPAFYNILLIWLFIFSVRKKLYSVILTAMPLFLSLMIVILAPVIQGHPRYAFPIIYTLPFVLSFYLFCDSKNDINNNN